MTSMSPASNCQPLLLPDCHGKLSHSCAILSTALSPHYHCRNHQLHFLMLAGPTEFTFSSKKIHTSTLTPSSSVQFVHSGKQQKVRMTPNRFLHKNVRSHNLQLLQQRVWTVNSQVRFCCSVSMLKLDGHVERGHWQDVTSIYLTSRTNQRFWKHCRHTHTDT